ncbi:MAG: hypothetical protein UR34_C0006G0010 [candidate division WS6 bacterium GW2011_GWC1_33_20]|uniref:Uncharacterized protein n=2 Tax=Candidatus Dojkabacteria TaxID=74243 RepID=A0A0G0AT05_9BACT|nr:MAG: hypothetical protein UR32_C0020G0002 [candidate division WS6 bacterium GW2011_GWE2_33_157]KKP44089.1 MAG: hypothetical protein UR34_C0006G0010 [candidate division WS6 bacterium GW2011_GWC1_33_20]KKP45039.1 MAG: hypothetical protein UR36_C0011G0016 [candidate division WS6 bacterium GW2011_GWF1_33_233]KKP54206.1 MAG: hypothetical protein UR45_C0022G0002 [candidate division WS6 bacterium GW2011_WS6_33_547]KKP54576.1 MAG: hypothetical protein UR47_C0014G0018 [candidate division WS6 bacteriu
MTLTEAAFWTKRFGVIVLGFLAVVVIVLFFLVPIGTPDLPPEYLTANYGCTDKKEDFLENRLTLPTLDILQDSKPTFDLKTVSGKFDNLPQIVNVYRYTNLGQKLNSQSEAKILAKKMGFDQDKIVMKGTTDYLWVNNTSQRSLDIKARDLNFQMTTDQERIKNLRKTLDLPTESEAKSLAINGLRSLGILDSEYTQMPQTVHLIDINPDGTYSEADSLVSAELIRVDFIRMIPMISIPTNIVGAEQMVSNLERKDMTYVMGTAIVNDERVDVYDFRTLITYQNPIKSNISVYVGPKDEGTEILSNIYQIEYTTWSLETESCGTYELIAPADASRKIENGEGSLVFLNSNQDEVEEYVPTNVKKFTINDVYITYYEGLIEQYYLQPVYMVIGQAELETGELVDFHMYYPAINYDTVQDKIELEPAPVKQSGPFSF